ncbi:hypothetical protein AeRB84_007303 [Aphanomyces euteiches]|nr:hypothetical protein AeRB84_007303 [Aphanomyces euteiches]
MYRHVVNYCSDLSFNQINEVTVQVPTSLNLLNLSHNALLNRWLQTPLPVQTLDVSYSHGGLPWIQTLPWEVYLPKLLRLYFRGNNLSQLSLSYANFPMYPFNALDLNDNPNVLLTVNSSVYNRFNYGNNTNFVRRISSTASFQEVYSAMNRTTAVYVCYWGYIDTSYNPGKIDAFNNILVALSIGTSGILLVWIVLRMFAAKWRERYQLYARETICSSNRSGYIDPTTTANHAIYVEQPATPRRN